MNAPEQAVTYPAHYSANDVALIGRIKRWIPDHKYTQAALARLARISGSTLTQILNGSYISSPAKMLAMVESAMRHAEETTADAVAPVETSVFKLAGASCSMARRYRNFAVLSCFVGTGKTFSLKCYARTHPNTHLIEADATMTPQSLVKLLARTVIGYDAKGSINDKFTAVIDTLKDTDSLIIVDEAETITPLQLDLIRRLRDKANIGIVLAGTEHLTAKLKPLHGQFDQIRSRTGFWPETVSGITREDAAALVQSSLGAEEIDDAVVDRLYAYSKGSARMLVEGLLAAIKEFRKGRVLDVKLVDAVAKQALCLQSMA